MPSGPRIKTKQLSSTYKMPLGSPMITRKTNRRARTHAVLASVLKTLKQQGRDALRYWTSVLTAPAEPRNSWLPLCSTPL